MFVYSMRIAKGVVRYVGHCFRHINNLVSKLLSLPLQERLTARRVYLGRREVPSVSAQRSWEFLFQMGFDLQPLVVGRPEIRGSSGKPLRWGTGWFYDIRDGGPGWDFSRADKAAVKYRSDLLFKLFVQKQSLSLSALLHDAQEAIADRIVGPLPLEDG